MTDFIDVKDNVVEQEPMTPLPEATVGENSLGASKVSTVDQSDT